ncbi:MAG TPA: hypothetical protein VMM15_00620, partial [Bradyrhizobium sp.]|nr:hypothetical protein [Bradyrhizobium sp.]
AGGALGGLTVRSKEFGLLVGTTILSLVLLEFGFRLWGGVALLQFPNFRYANAIRIDLNEFSLYDAKVGWTTKPGLSFPTFSTVAYGIRRTNREQTGIRPGNILVVGSSFAAGSEVTDLESWPARVEAHLNQPVDNAAVGAYSMVQIILRAEQLLPVERPRILLIDTQMLAVEWNTYSVRDRPTPYFTIEGGQLVAHNDPVPILDLRDVRSDTFKNVIGHSYVVDRLMAALKPVWWYSASETVLRRSEGDDAEITCRLLANLKTKTDAAHVRPALVVSYSAPEIRASERSTNIQLIESCASTAGYQIIDVFERFREQYLHDQDALGRLYVKHGDAYGHFAPGGNDLVGRTIAESLSEDFVAPATNGSRNASFAPGDGRNLIAASEAIDTPSTSRSNAELARIDSKSGEAGEFLETATDGAAGRGAPPKPSEHYLVTAPVTLEAGPYTLSFEVKPIVAPLFRAQLLGKARGDDAMSGVIADVDFAHGVAPTTRMGLARELRGSVKPIGGGWYRVNMGAIMPGGDTQIILQLAGADDGKYDFLAGNESVALRAMQLERGQTASEYHPTKGMRESSDAKSSSSAAAK